MATLQQMLSTPSAAKPFFDPIDAAMKQKSEDAENRRKALLALSERRALPETFRFAPYKGAGAEGMEIGNMPQTAEQESKLAYQGAQTELTQAQTLEALRPEKVKSRADIIKPYLPAGTRFVSKVNAEKNMRPSLKPLEIPGEGLVGYFEATKKEAKKGELDFSKILSPQTISKFEPGSVADAIKDKDLKKLKLLAKDFSASDIMSTIRTLLSSGTVLDEKEATVKAMQIAKQINPNTRWQDKSKLKNVKKITDHYINQLDYPDKQSALAGLEANRKRMEDEGADIEAIRANIEERYR